MGRDEGSHLSGGGKKLIYNRHLGNFLWYKVMQQQKKLSWVRNWAWCGLRLTGANKSEEPFWLLCLRSHHGQWIFIRLFEDYRVNCTDSSPRFIDKTKYFTPQSNRDTRAPGWRAHCGKFTSPFRRELFEREEWLAHRFWEEKGKKVNRSRWWTPPCQVRGCGELMGHGSSFYEYILVR